MEEKKDKKNVIIAICAVVIIVLVIVIISLLGNKEKSDVETSFSTEEALTNGISVGLKNTNTDNNVIKLNLNETATKDNKYELTVIGNNFGKTILPPNTSGYYRYYEAKEDGHQYLEVKYNYKNLGESGVTADDIATMTIKYDNKYEYTGFSVIEDSDSDFTYANITDIAPLTTGKLHYLFDVPDEVVNGSGSIIATIKCGSDTYEITLR